MHGNGERSGRRPGPDTPGNTARERSDRRGILLPGLWSARASSGLSQRELAQVAGTAQNTVYELETLARGAYPRTIRKLCRALEVEPWDLARDEPHTTTKGSTMSQVIGGIKDGRFILRATYDTKSPQDMDEMMRILRDPDTDTAVTTYDEDHVEVDIRPGW